MTLVTEILNGLDFINKPQQKFLAVLFSTMLVCHSAINFLSLSRHSAWSERTFRRGFRREFDFARLNLQAAARLQCVAPVAVALDASFIKKSGKRTFGLDKFWNGSCGRAEKGLEVSLIALIDTEQNRAFALSAEQTPAATVAATALTTTEERRETRMDFYLQHFERSLPLLPASVQYTLVDGCYAKEKFVSGVCQKGFHVISRLRVDANLRFLYRGEQRQGRGRPRKFDGKVNLTELSRFESVTSDDHQLSLRTLCVWSVSLKQEIRVLILHQRGKKSEKERAVILFSTDLELDPKELLRLYRSRFHIEFLFRDAKQNAGLETCQARDKETLAFHWNAAFACVNLARVIAQEKKQPAQCEAFSMKSIKQQTFNEHFLELFISRLDLEPTLIKNHRNYEKLRNYAVIAT